MLVVALFCLLQVIQLYEMTIARHGLKVVGLPFSGKTCSLKVLAGALTYLHEKGLSGTLFNKIHTRNINPKSVTMGQLYGENDKATQEWKDGVLQLLFANWLQIAHPIASGSSLMALWMLSRLKT